jgi:plastocyanin
VHTTGCTGTGHCHRNDDSHFDSYDRLTPELTPLQTTIITTVPLTVKGTLSPQTKIVTAIHIQNNTFVPQTLTVLPRTGITWINDDSYVQSVKSIGNNTGMFNSGDIIPGAQWSYTFNLREGSYEFTSAIPPGNERHDYHKKRCVKYQCPPINAD